MKRPISDRAIPADKVTCCLLVDLQHAWAEQKRGVRTSAEVAEIERIGFGYLVKYLATMVAEDWLLDRADEIVPEV